MGTDTQYAASYRQEALDLLADIDAATLELEKDESNLELVNRLFRAFHTIKGSGAMFGFDEIARFAHHVETTLDDVRSARVQVSSELIDLILAARDSIEILLVKSVADQNAHAGRRDEIVRNLNRLRGMADDTEHPVLTKGSGSQNAGPPPATNSHVAYSVRFAPGPDVMKRGNDPLALLKELGRLGEATAVARVEHLPELDMLVPEECHLSWEVTLVTDSSVEAIRDVFIFVEDECELEIELKSSGYPDRAEPPQAGADSVAAETSNESDGLIRDFQLEAAEHIESSERALITLDGQHQDQGAINTLLRGMHSIKGTSSYLGLSAISKLTHASESLLETVREGGGTGVTDSQLDLLFCVLDSLKTLVGNPTKAQPDHSLLDRLLGENTALEGGRNTGLPAATPSDASFSPAQAFLESAHQYIAPIGDLLRQASEQGCLIEPNLGSLLRAFRSLKSSASYMGYQELAKRCEDVDADLGSQLRGAEAHPEPIIERTLRSFDDIKRLVAALETPQEATSQAAGGRAAAEALSDAVQPAVAETPQVSRADDALKTMRIDQAALDVFMNLVGELIVSRNTFHHIAKELEDDESNRAAALKELHEASQALDRISGGLQRKVMEMRMVPVRDLFKRFPRLVRDVMRKHHKQVKLVLEGEDTEIDKGIAEDLVDPLVHIVRNSLDHGIEEPSVRRAAQKVEAGTLLLRAGQEGNVVFIEIVDDGAGIDPNRVLSKAIEKGLVSPERAKELSQEEIYSFIFLPGFSTAKTVTDISGRGVGMDVVQTNLRKLKGTVRLTSEVGQGTKVRLEVPLTLAIMDVLLVGLGRNTYAIPLQSVTEIVEGGKQHCQALMGKRAIALRGEVVQVEMLSDLLNVQAVAVEGRDASDFAILVVQMGNQRRGIGVDALYRRQEIVIKPLADYLSALPGVAGATILGDGRPVIILDPMSMLRASRK